MAEEGRNRSPSIVNFGALLHRLNTSNKSLVRNLEKIYKKQVQVSYGLMFNRTCLLENILPKYTNLRSTNPGLRYEDCTFKYRRDVLIKKLETCESELSEIVRDNPS